MMDSSRPATATDCRGVPVSFANREAIDGLEAAHQCTLTFSGDALAIIDEILKEHPNFVMGHLFKACWLTQAMETRIYKDMVAAIEAADALSGIANERELGYLAAGRAWIEGDFHGAVQLWEAILTRYPMDLFALQLVHITQLLLGDVAGQRDVVARVFNLWDESIPGYEFVLGFYAFGLEENSDYQKAEEMGRRALAMRPDDPYAVHAVAHVMEMQGRQSGGIRFMGETSIGWGSSHFANHLWWHTGLFHLDLGDTASALSIFDQHLRSDGLSGDKYEELDASALLWRLKLLDVETGDRWSELADKWEASASDTLYAFNDVHAMMTFVSDDRHDAQETLLGANERYLENASDANTAMSREIGMPFCLAMQDYHKGAYKACVERLLPVRYRTFKLGGSYAQRDVIGWTLLEAALRAKEFDLALGLANERCALKPTSMQNWNCVARAFEGLGDHSNASRARAKAASLSGF